VRSRIVRCFSPDAIQSCSGGSRKELEGGIPQKKKNCAPPKCEKPLHNEVMNNIQDKFIALEFNTYIKCARLQYK
jgi:hypothetical protein